MKSGGVQTLWMGKEGTMMKNKSLILFLFIIQFPLQLSAQQYTGTSGLIHVPSAEMDSVPVIKAGFHYVPKEMLPDEMTDQNEKYNSGTYYVSITPFRWVELSYCRTLWKLQRGPTDEENPPTSLFYGSKRLLSLRFRLLEEGSWWPSVLVGESNIFKSLLKGEISNNAKVFFSASKHLNYCGWIIGCHISYRYYKDDSYTKWKGVAGGITVQPAFYNSLRAIFEYDGNSINVGADCLIFKHLQLQASLIDLHHFAGGACLYITL